MKLTPVTTVKYVIEWEVGDDWNQLVTEAINLAKISKDSVQIEFKGEKFNVNQNSDDVQIIETIRRKVGF